MQIKGKIFGTSETTLDFENGVITALGGAPKADALDFGELLVLPGFIDVHTHGAMGRDTMDADDEAMQTMKKHMASHGVTSFLPTTVTMPAEALCRAAEAAKRNRYGDGAEILGVHLEGPYFSPQYKGAQNPAYLRQPDIAEMDTILQRAGGFVKLVSLAPELPGAGEMIRFLTAHGVTVAGGHTAADYEQTVAGIESGITEATHLYNAMTPLSHRAPGVVGAMLEDRRVYAELICDGVHVHPAAAKLAIRAKGSDRVILISDSMSAAGMEDGVYDLGGQEVTVRDGQARIANGALAGGISNVFDCFRNVVKWGVPLEDAARMASENPAASIHAEKKGRLCAGCDADMTVVNERLELVCTIIRGRVWYKK